MSIFTTLLLIFYFGYEYLCLWLFVYEQLSFNKYNNIGNLYIIWTKKNGKLNNQTQIKPIRYSTMGWSYFKDNIILNLNKRRSSPCTSKCFWRFLCSNFYSRRRAMWNNGPIRLKFGMSNAYIRILYEKISIPAGHLYEFYMKTWTDNNKI